MNIRTDLAIEAFEEYGYLPESVECYEENRDGIKISRVHIKDITGEVYLKKPKGKYITLDMKNIASMLPEERKKAAKVVADELEHLVGRITGGVLVVGLGNRAITPDSIGPKTCDGIFVTRHIKEHIPDAIDERASTVFSIAPGVLGVTGMESAEVVKGIAQQTRPELIIAIDALAARNTDRIGSSVQMTDSGISPGAGLGNRRSGLNEENLNIKVVAIGVPTVVYASTIAADMLYEIMGDADNELRDRLIKRSEGSKGSELVVSPKDIDNLSTYAAKLIAAAVNMAINPHISDDEIEIYMN